MICNQRVKKETNKLVARCYPRVLRCNCILYNQSEHPAMEREYKAAPAGESSGRSSQQKAKLKTKNSSSVFNGAVALTASEFARAEACMTNPGEPTAAAHRGAALLRKLYGSNR